MGTSIQQWKNTVIERNKVVLPEMGTSTQQWKNTVIERNKEEEQIKVKTHHAK
jgi:hypothetical protein